MALRVIGYGLLFTAAAWSLADSWQFAVCVGAAAALVAAVERRSARIESGGAGRSGRSEPERDAVARRISLELSCDRSEAVLESLREGVIVVDGAGEVVMANPAARRALARPLQDPIGRLLWEELDGNMARHAREAWQTLHEEVTDTADVAAVPQIRYPTIACRELFFDLTAVRVMSQGTGQDFGTVFLLVDSTRNHELQQLKDRFLSSVSHELRTPLTNICAYSEILGTLLPGDSVEWPEFVRVINEESVQLSRLVDGMFDFLQLESGEATFRFEELDGGAVLQAIVRPFVEPTGARGIAFEVTERPCSQLVEADRSRLEQICRHLVDNAIKFTPEGGSVQVAFGEVDGGFELRVEDSGPGVPVDDRASVFDKFTQLRDHMTDKPAGAGVGLATCRAIVGRFGGLIWCEDSHLGGAAFVVRLPLAGQPKLNGASAVGAF